MKKKGLRYEGMLDSIPSFQIRLNINHLKNGKYTLKIVHKNKIIKQTHFTKTRNNPKNRS
ncbi:MAG: hypothetical protein AAF039_14950 [Bacteroidota bacterium]